MLNPDKQRYFDRGGELFLSDPRAEEWREEYQRCNCKTCYDENCKARFRGIRFPVDVGGQGQCIRNESAKNRFAFRNVDGTVIVIPEDIICQKR